MKNPLKLIGPNISDNLKTKFKASGIYSPDASQALKRLSDSGRFHWTGTEWKKDFEDYFKERWKQRTPVELRRKRVENRDQSREEFYKTNIRWGLAKCSRCEKFKEGQDKQLEKDPKAKKWKDKTQTQTVHMTVEKLVDYLEKEFDNTLNDDFNELIGDITYTYVHPVFMISSTSWVRRIS